MAEWADRYIDYARLKLYIKKAKKAAEAYEALEKRRPEVAAEVKAAYDAGIPYSSASGRNSTTASALSLSKAADDAGAGGESGDGTTSDGTTARNGRDRVRNVLISLNIQINKYRVQIQIHVYTRHVSQIKL